MVIQQARRGNEDRATELRRKTSKTAQLEAQTSQLSVKRSLSQTEAAKKSSNTQLDAKLPAAPASSNYLDAKTVVKSLYFSDTQSYEEHLASADVYAISKSISMKLRDTIVNLWIVITKAFYNLCKPPAGSLMACHRSWLVN